MYRSQNSGEMAGFTEFVAKRLIVKGENPQYRCCRCSTIFRLSDYRREESERECRYHPAKKVKSTFASAGFRFIEWKSFMYVHTNTIFLK